MSLIEQMTDKEKAIVMAEPVPDFDLGGADLDADRLDAFFAELHDWMQPFASYVLNRVSVWLEENGRWAGDEHITAEWFGGDYLDALKAESPTPAQRSCRLTKKATGGVWHVDFHPKRSEPSVCEIVLSEARAGGGQVVICRGDLVGEGKDRHQFPIKAGAVDADIDAASFVDLCEFAEAIRPSIPQSLLVREPVRGILAFMPMMPVLQAAALDVPLLVADKGLPSWHCRARLQYLANLMSRSTFDWVREKVMPLIDGLSAVGANWGSDKIVYGDGDFACSSISFPDGYLGYIALNRNSSSEIVGYIVRLVRKGGHDVGSIGIYALSSGAGISEQVDSILSREVTADFVYSFEASRPYMMGGRASWIAFEFFLRRFVQDNERALVEGVLQRGENAATGLSER